MALTLLAALPARADIEVEFYAVVDKETIAENEPLKLTITLSHDANARNAEVLLPEVGPDFRVISKSQSQQSTFNMSGSGPASIRNIRVYNLTLAPQKTGRLTIPPAALLLDKKRYETARIKVDVVPGAQAEKDDGASNEPKAGGNKAARSKRRAAGQTGAMLGSLLGLPDDVDLESLEESLEALMGGLGEEAVGGDVDKPSQRDSDVFVRAVFDKKQAYLGEQITLSVLLYARGDVSGINSLQLPKLDGFWAEDIETPTQITGERQVIDGVPYRVYLLRRRALFPLKAGKLTLDPVSADISMGMGFFFSGGRQIRRESNRASVEVLPLPQKAPAGFESANVGRWRLSASAKPTRTRLDQPITLTLTLEGTGNLRNIAMPKLPDLPGFKVYDPTRTEKTSVTKNRFGGRRVFEYLLMPTQTGTFTLPALELPYFDPTAKAYRTAQTRAMELQVEAGAPGAAVAFSPPGTASLGTPPGAPAVNLLGAQGLRPLRYSGELRHPAPPLHRRAGFLPLLLLPFFAGLGVLVLNLAASALRRGDGERRTGGAGKRLRRRLRKADKLLAAGEADAFYAEVSRALNDYLSDKLRCPVIGITRPELAAWLTEAGAEAADVEPICRALDTCDAGRFAPGGTEKATMQQRLDDALAAMNQLEARRLQPRQKGSAP